MHKKVREDDVQAVFDCWMQDEDVSRYMWWKASEDINEAKGFVAYELEQLENENWNRWIIELKESKRRYSLQIYKKVKMNAYVQKVHRRFFIYMI